MSRVDKLKSKQELYLERYERWHQQKNAKVVGGKADATTHQPSTLADAGYIGITKSKRPFLTRTTSTVNKQAPAKPMSSFKPAQMTRQTSSIGNIFGRSLGVIKSALQLKQKVAPLDTKVSVCRSSQALNQASRIPMAAVRPLQSRNYQQKATIAHVQPSKTGHQSMGTNNTEKERAHVERYAKWKEMKAAEKQMRDGIKYKHNHPTQSKPGTDTKTEQTSHNRREAVISIKQRVSVPMTRRSTFSLHTKPELPDNKHLRRSVTGLPHVESLHQAHGIKNSHIGLDKRRATIAAEVGNKARNNNITADEQIRRSTISNMTLAKPEFVMVRHGKRTFKDVPSRYMTGASVSSRRTAGTGTGTVCTKLKLNNDKVSQVNRLKNSSSTTNVAAATKGKFKVPSMSMPNLLKSNVNVKQSKPDRSNNRTPKRKSERGLADCHSMKKARFNVVDCHGHESDEETDGSMREQLGNWLRVKGKTPSRFRHLMCFDAQMSELKKKDALTKRHLNIDELSEQQQALSDEAIKFSLAAEFERVAKEEEERQQQWNEKLNRMLEECLTLFEAGCPVEGLIPWLDRMQDSLPGAVQSVQFWLTRAQILESTGDTDKVLESFEHAVRHGAQPADELATALTQTVKRLTEAKKREKTPTRQHTPRLRTFSNSRRSLEAGLYEENIFESTTIKYCMNEGPPLLTRLHAASNTPSPCAVITPVRRSTRRSLATIPEMLQEKNHLYNSISDMSEAEHESTLFQPNRALDDLLATAESSV